MHIFLHIGQSKTGTSAIQAYLTLNRLALRKAGVLYPSVAISGMSVDMANHNPVADALAGLSEFPHLTADQYFDLFFAEAQKFNVKHMILSAEHFFGGEPRVWNVQNEDTFFDLYNQKINALKKYLDGFDVTVIVYLRPQVDWIASAISQTVRIENLISPEKAIYCSDRHFFEMIKPLVRYYKLIDIWVKTLSPKEMIVIPYERKQLHKKSSIADFMYRISLDHLDLPFGSEVLQVNRSLTREYIEVKKILNRTRRSKNDERVIISCLERLSARSGKTTRYHLYGELSRDIIQFVKSENDQLNENYIHVDFKLKAQSDASLDSNNKKISEKEISVALSEFKREFYSLRTRITAFDITARDFLRKHAKLLHAAFHQLKRVYWSHVFRK